MVFDAIAKALASKRSIEPAEVAADLTVEMSLLAEVSNVAMPLCRSMCIHGYVLEWFRVCPYIHRSYGYC